MGTDLGETGPKRTDFLMKTDNPEKPSDRATGWWPGEVGRKAIAPQWPREAAGDFPTRPPLGEQSRPGTRWEPRAPPRRGQEGTRR